MPGAQLPCVKAPCARAGGTPAPLSPSPRAREVALHPTRPSPSPWAPPGPQLGGVEHSPCGLTFSLWFERRSLVFVLIAEDRPCLPGTDRLRTPHPRPKHAGSLVPASETLPFMHLFGKYLSTASPLCPLLEGQRRGQEPCSIRGGRLGKRPSPLQQFSV